TNNEKAKVLAKALDKANGQFLNENKSPSRKVGELDNRGSHFYLALYWAKALAEQDSDSDLKGKFSPVYEELSSKEATIVDELNKAQGSPVDVGGYYHPNSDKVSQAMRPSSTLNTILKSLL
ncbi:MAG: NADP-dependent isocitrate dehydrogenase, partial [Bdellovibrionota bacterium]|nr:NADP-dependent isocitrate dehydrogenase [Bdellovibrionota bacterium]